MARAPSYPAEDAPVGDPDDNEQAADKASEARRKKQIVAGAAIGIGSAALVAALLYANRSRGKDKKGG